MIIVRDTLAIIVALNRYAELVQLLNQKGYNLRSIARFSRGLGRAQDACLLVVNPTQNGFKTLAHILDDPDINISAEIGIIKDHRNLYKVSETHYTVFNKEEAILKNMFRVFTLPQRNLSSTKHCYSLTKDFRSFTYVKNKYNEKRQLGGIRTKSTGRGWIQWFFRR